MTHPTPPAATRVPVGVEVGDVTAEYVPGQPILRNLSMSIPAGRLTVIIGPNGSGKSTVLRVLAGLLPVRSGSVTLTRGDAISEVSSVPAHQRSTIGIGFLPQGHSVFPAMSVHDNLLLGAWPIRRDRRRSRAAIADVYQRYPVLDERRGRPAGSLSGGQQRILELARMLVAGPSVLLIDEPSAGVAPLVAAQMYRELETLGHDGHTIVLVDQDVRPALAIADHVYVLKSGTVHRDGATDDFTGSVEALVQEWLIASDPNGGAS